MTHLRITWFPHGEFLFSSLFPPSILTPPHHSRTLSSWSRLSKHAREEEGVQIKRVKMTDEEIEEQPVSKRRKVMYRMALGTKEAIKAWKDSL